MGKIIFFDDYAMCLNGCLFNVWEDDDYLDDSPYEQECFYIGEYNDRIQEYYCEKCKDVYYSIQTKHGRLKLLFTKDILPKIDKYLESLDIFIARYIASNKNRIKLSDIMQKHNYLLKEGNFYQDIVFGFYEKKTKEIACQVCKHRKTYNLNKFFNFNELYGYSEIKCEKCGSNISLVYYKGELMYHVQTLATNNSNAIIKNYLQEKCINEMLEYNIDEDYVFGGLK